MSEGHELWRERYYKLRRLIESCEADGFIPKEQLAAYLGQQDILKSRFVVERLGVLLKGLLEGGAVTIIEEDKPRLLRVVVGVTAVRDQEALAALDKEAGDLNASAGACLDGTVNENEEVEIDE